MHLRELSEINAKRCQRWHGEDGVMSWSPNDWATAMGGENGEVNEAILDFIAAMLADITRVTAHSGRAQDLCKKLRRLSSNVVSNNNPPDIEAAIKAIGNEIADTFWYLDLLAHRLGLDMETIVVEKFNDISRREYFTEFVIGE